MNCRLLVLVLCCSYAVAADSQEIKRSWKTGYLVESGMKGYGRHSGGSARKPNIWWTYSIESGDRIYSAESRTSPGKMKLKLHEPVKFEVGRDRIHIQNNRGERYTLRLVRQTAKMGMLRPGGFYSSPHGLQWARRATHSALRSCKKIGAAAGQIC